MADDFDELGKHEFIIADYENPDYVELVRAGLAQLKGFHAISSWVEHGHLVFEDGEGHRIAFEPFGHDEPPRE